MKNQATLFLYLFLFFSISISAQGPISGTLLDTDGNPIYFGTIALMTIDSAIVQGVSTDENGKSS